MRNDPFHNATRGVFNTWMSEITARQGMPFTQIDWSAVSPGEAWRLAEDQFAAAEVPPAAIHEYYSQWNQYLTEVGWWSP